MDDLSIYQIKLITGEDIIAYVSNDLSPNQMDLERPFIIEASGMNENQYALYPWFGLSFQKTFAIQRSRIIAFADVLPQVKEMYIKYAIEYYKESNKPKVLSPLESDQMIAQKVMTMLNEDNEPVDELATNIDNTKKKTIH